MKNKDEKGIINLANAYKSAENGILKAVNTKKVTVAEYQKIITKAVNDAVKILAKKNERFVDEELPNAFSEGQNKTQSQTPNVHTTMTAKDVSSILRQAGFRYSGKGLQYDTYLEVQSATESAGKNFISRINERIKELEKSGQDTLYNVQEAVKDDLKNNGILNVEYRGGRKVSLDSYARMAVRSARIESANIGAFGRALENGTDYVKCTTISPTCEICAKYQGKIYCISGKDKRFPALFETALHHGYALMHPNCRHEFIPVWLETMSDKELEREIQNSKIVDKDVRSVKERNEYAAWQDKQRQEYHERQYFEQAKKTLGDAMPYKDLAAFRRSYRAKEGTTAYKLSHNLLRDYKEFIGQKENGINSFAKFRQKRYNKPAGAKGSDDAQPHGEIRYPAIRNNPFDIKKIAKNTGYTVEEITAIKNYLFYEEHDLGDGEVGRFYPDDDIAKTWDRLTAGTDIREEDWIFIKHELYERELVSQGVDRNEAHIKATKKFDYQTAVDNAKLKKNRKSK